MEDALIQVAPADDFLFAATRANDLCVAATTSTQRILVSPIKGSNYPATLAVSAAGLGVSGQAYVTEGLQSHDFNTLAIRFRRSNAASGFVAGGVDTSAVAPGSVGFRSASLSAPVVVPPAEPTPAELAPAGLWALDDLSRLTAALSTSPAETRFALDPGRAFGAITRLAEADPALQADDVTLISPGCVVAVSRDWSPAASPPSGPSGLLSACPTASSRASAVVYGVVTSAASPDQGDGVAFGPFAAARGLLLPPTRPLMEVAVWGECDAWVVCPEAGPVPQGARLCASPDVRGAFCTESTGPHASSATALHDVHIESCPAERVQERDARTCVLVRCRLSL